MSHPVPEDIYETFKEAFKVFETDTEGEVNVSDIENVTRSLGLKLTSGEIKDMINEIDYNNDGVIELDEFCEWMAAKSEEVENLDDTEVLFDRLDVDKDGFISVGDLMSIFESFGEKMSVDNVLHIVKDVDKSDSGHVNYDDFKLVVSKFQSVSLEKGVEVKEESLPYEEPLEFD